MKKILNVIVLTLAVNFLAVAAGVGWLHQTAGLNREKIMAIKDVLFPKPVEEVPATQPAADPTTQPYAGLEALLAKASGRPATEQVDFMTRSFEAQTALLERRQRELNDLQRQVDQSKNLVAKERTSLEAEQKALDAREQQAARLAGDKGFQDSLALYNVMPAKQVKTIFMGMDDPTVTNYLQAMAPRTASKIIKEFKSDEEMARVKKIMEKMPQVQASAKE